MTKIIFSILLLTNLLIAKNIENFINYQCMAGTLTDTSLTNMHPLTFKTSLEYDKDGSILKSVYIYTSNKGIMKYFVSNENKNIFLDADNIFSIRIEKNLIEVMLTDRKSGKSIIGTNCKVVK